jgi:hypothetical protein
MVYAYVSNEIIVAEGTVVNNLESNNLYLKKYTVEFILKI